MNRLTGIGLPLSEPLDALLADIAIRVQLSATNYRLAVERYQTINEWIERDGSPLEGRVAMFHPQGSMAIGATIASKLEKDEFDIDLIAILDLSADTPPHKMLDILEQAIRDEPGSRYYDKTERCTRCIQIRYADGMHLDVTPMVRIPELPERCGFIYHAPECYPTADDKKIVANPWGFAQWFLAHTPADRLFQTAFAKRAKAYEAAMLLAEAEVEPVPERSPVYEKSMAVIALQLMKRFRNVRYDQRAVRCPPSVFLSKTVADNTGRTATLSEELIFQASQLRDLLANAQTTGNILDVRNPTCYSDRFTDRWPGTLDAQRVFLADMTLFVEKIGSLRGECDLGEMQKILSEFFGENATLDAVRQFNKRVGQEIVYGRSQHVPGAGQIVVPSQAVASTLGAVAAIPAIARATPKHTYFGKFKNS